MRVRRLFYAGSNSARRGSGKSRFRSYTSKDLLKKNRDSFNMPVEFDRFIRSFEAPVKLVLGMSQIVEGHIIRTANRNGTACIMGVSELRD